MTVTQLAPTYRYSPPRRLNSLSIVIVGRDRAETIEATVDKAIEVAAAVADRYEVLVVDDGSTDATASIVQKIKDRRGGCIRLLRNSRTIGYGPSIRRGWSAAGMEWLLSVGSDGQFDRDAVMEFVPLTDRADIITGWRKSGVDASIRGCRSRTFNLACRVVFRTGVHDANCALKLMRTAAVRRLELSSATLSNVELFYQAREHGLAVAEVPIQDRRNPTETRSDAYRKDSRKPAREFIAMRLRFNRPEPKRIRLHTRLVGLLALVSGLAATVWAYSTQTILAYGDAEAHLNISKRVVSGLTAGMAQLGSVWLPLPHILMLPFVVNDDLWRTGLAGAAVGVPCLVLAAVMSYRTSYLLTGSIPASWLAPVVIVANPNTLYLSATPMTELLLLAMVATSLYFLCKWVLHDGVNSLVLAAVFASLATLARYDGWIFVLIEAVVVLVTAAVRYRTRAGVEGVCVLFGVLAFTGILGWLLWNQLIFSDPLYFAQSVYGSAEQQQFFLRQGLLPTYHDAGKSVLYWLEDVRIIAGLALMLLAALGLAFLIAGAIRDRRIGPPLIAAAALSCFVFYIVSLYLGQASLILPRFVPPDSIYRMSNLRYGLQALLPIGVFIAYLAARRPRVLVPILTVIVAAQGVYFVGTRQAMAYQDGTVGLSSQHVSKGPDSPPVEGWLRQNYDGGLVLMDDYRRPVGPVESGIPMGSFIGVGNKPFWQESLRNPAQHAEWIILQQANTDAVWSGLAPVSRNILADHFVAVFRSGQIIVYKRRPELEDVIEKRGQHLYLDGKRWNSVGVNSYDLLEQPMSVIDQRLSNLAGSGFNTVRTWCFDVDGGLSGETLEKLANALSSARERGMRVVCTIGNALPDFGGQHYFTPFGEDFFSSPTARSRYRQQIHRLLEYRDAEGVRMADQQAMLAWDLLNEPRPNPNTPRGAVADWTEEMASYVASLDQLHLVTIGAEGFGPGYPYDRRLTGLPGADFETLCRIPSITLCSSHLYPKYLSDPASSEVLGDTIQIWREAAEELGKPLFLEEVGYSYRDAGSFDVRQAFYDNVARAINNSDVDGGLLWNVGEVVDDTFTLQYGDPDSDRTLSAWGSMIHKTR
ncbi:glycosyltransferase [Mycolicibacterium mengxianglii]|uniref:glycosyltransferase n=1 Tax=Mycolicibacterium mengxianglii TaxID=2736649 RepID=UPI0018EF1D5B|nr:glycosyltransferase [Mycolicibacterium mengxianglii]